MEKAHAERVAALESGIDPDTREPVDYPDSGKGKKTRGNKGRDKTQRYGVTKWHPQNFAGTPEGYFAKLMQKPVGQPRRSFVHDPYKTRVSKILHGDAFGQKGNHVKVESRWQSRQAANMNRKWRDTYV